MARIFTDFGDGTLANAVTATATTLTSGEFRDLPTITPADHLVAVLDPDADHGHPEIVHIIEHAANAVTVTATRGHDTLARTHPADTRWVAPITAADMRRLDTIEADGWVTADRIAAGAVGRAAIAAGAAVPHTTNADNGKVLQVVDGQWGAVPLPLARRSTSSNIGDTLRIQLPGVPAIALAAASPTAEARRRGLGRLVYDFEYRINDTAWATPTNWTRSSSNDAVYDAAGWVETSSAGFIEWRSGYTRQFVPPRVELWWAVVFVA